MAYEVHVGGAYSHTEALAVGLDGALTQGRTVLAYPLRFDPQGEISSAGPAEQGALGGPAAVLYGGSKAEGKLHRWRFSLAPTAASPSCGTFVQGAVDLSQLGGSFTGAPNPTTQPR